MWPNPQFPVDLVTFTEEILNGKLHFCAVWNDFIDYTEDWEINHFQPSGLMESAGAALSVFSIVNWQVQYMTGTLYRRWWYKIF